MEAEFWIPWFLEEKRSNIMALKKLLIVDRECENFTNVSRRVILICTLLLVFVVVGVSSAANIGDVVPNSIGMKLVWIPPAN